MHIRNGKRVPHLFHNCVVANKLWSMIFCLFGVTRAMPYSVNELLSCCKEHFGICKES